MLLWSGGGGIHNIVWKYACIKILYYVYIYIYL